MQKTRETRLIRYMKGFASVFAAVICLVLLPQSTHAAEVLETDTASAGTSCTMLGVYGSYFSDMQAALDRINEIRYEACETGVIDPRDTSRTLTTDDYVPIKWSTALEQIARFRAVEGGIAYYLSKGTSNATGHQRLNSSNLYSWHLTYGGTSNATENLAYGNTTLTAGVNNWYGEKSIWDARGTGETGHYTSMIDPDNTYVGVGGFSTSALSSKGTVAAAFSTSEGTMGSGFLEAKTDVIQKVSVMDAYLTGTDSIDVEAAMNPGDQQALSLLTQVSMGGTYSLNLWRLDEVTYTTSSSSVISVSGNVITAQKTGQESATAVISASVGGSVVASSEITVNCPHDYVYSDPVDGVMTGTCHDCGKTITINVPSSFAAYWKNSQSGPSNYGLYIPTSNSVGSDLMLCFTVDGDAGYKEVIVESSDPSVIAGTSVASGQTMASLPILGSGLAKLTVYPRYNPALAQTFILRAGEDGSLNIADAQAEFSPTYNLVYNGAAKKPGVTVTYGGMELISGTDYTLTYSDNVDAGEATATLTGLGLFGGSKDCSFTITPIDLSGAALTVGTKSYECDGTAKTPAVTVKTGTSTVASSNYTVTYADNVYPGTATVTVTGTGNYGGSVSATFLITHTSHTYGEWEVIQEAGCTQDGQEQRSCLYCEDTETQDIPAKGHSYGDWEEMISPTCEDAGSEQRACQVCGQKETRDLDPKGHAWENDYRIDKAATCTSEGSRSIHCQSCDAVKDAETIKMLPHVWDAEEGLVTEDATCLKDGVRTWTCTSCGTQKTQAIPATGHSFTSYATIEGEEADCEHAGNEIAYCDNDCGARDVRTVDALGHEPVTDDAVAATCMETGLTEGSHCARCGKVLTTQKETAALGHNAGTVITNATLKKNGSHVTVCRTCGAALSSETIARPLKFTLSYTTTVYSGSAKKPTLTVSDSSGKTIAASNYSLTYTNNKKVGTASLKVTFKGNFYTGSKNLYFKINPKATSISGITAQKKAFTVRWSGISAQADGYQIQYATSSKFSSAKTVTIAKNSTVSKKVTKLTAKKKYYVRVRTYRTVSGKKYYSGWSKTKSVTTKA